MFCIVAELEVLLWSLAMELSNSIVVWGAVRIVDVDVDCVVPCTACVSGGVAAWATSVTLRSLRFLVALCATS